MTSVPIDPENSNTLNLSRYTVTPNIERRFTKINVSPLAPPRPSLRIFSLALARPVEKSAAPQIPAMYFCHFVFVKHSIRSSTNHAVS